MENHTEFYKETESVEEPASEWQSPTLFVLLATFTVCTLIQRSTRSKSLKSIQNNISNSVKGLEAIPKFPAIWPISLLTNIPFTVPPSQIIKYAEEKAKTCGETVRFYGFGYNIVVLNSASLCETIFKSGKAGHLHRPGLAQTFLKKVVRTGFLVANGKLWEKQRKITMRSMKSSILEVHMESLCWHSKLCVDNLEKLFKENDVYQSVKEELGFLYLGFLLETSTGYRNPKSDAFIKAQADLTTIVNGFGMRLVSPLLYIFWSLHPHSLKQNRASADFQSFITQAVREHKERHNIDASLNTMDKPRNLTDEMLEDAVDEEQIVEDIVGLLLAGADTSPCVANFFCMMMSLHPDVQARCQQEVDELIEKNPEPWDSGTVSLSTAESELKYLERCLMETVRIFPPIPALARELSTPLDILHQGSTVRLPADTYILYSSYLIHRKAEYYPEPEKYDPDRFLPGEVKKRPQYAFIPFSRGPRSCVASRLAIIQLKISLAYLLRNFEMKAVGSMEDITLVPHFILSTAEPFQFRFTKRNK